MREEINLSREAREIAYIREEALKQRMANRYNSSAVPHKFEEGDLVLRRANIGQPIPGHEKLTAN